MEKENRFKIQGLSMLGLATLMLAGFIVATRTNTEAMHSGNLGLVWLVLIALVAASGILALIR